MFDKEPEPGEEGGAKLAYVLMPLIDAFNHASLPTKTEFEFSAAAFRLRSPTRVKENEEVFISYGALGNDELLVRYGFVALDESAVEHDTYVYQGLAAWLDANHEPCRRLRRWSRTKNQRRAPGDDVSQGVFGATGPRTRTWRGAACALATPEEGPGGQHLRRVQAGGGAGETPPERRRERAQRAWRDGNLRRRGRAALAGDVRDRARRRAMPPGERRILSRAVQKYARPSTSYSSTLRILLKVVGALVCIPLSNGRSTTLRTSSRTPAAASADRRRRCRVTGHRREQARELVVLWCGPHDAARALAQNAQPSG